MKSLTRYQGITGKLFDTNKIRHKITQAIDQASRQVLADFKKTTATWAGKPVFTVTKQGEFTRIVGTENEIYDFVSHGTRPHVIRPVNAPALAFQVGYSAKTAVNVIGSSNGGSSGPVAFAQEVQHPGTKARNFEQVISKAIQPKIVRSFDKIFQDAMR